MSSGAGRRNSRRPVRYGEDVPVAGNRKRPPTPSIERPPKRIRLEALSDDEDYEDDFVVPEKSVVNQKERWETLLLQQQVTEKQLQNLKSSTDMLRTLDDIFPEDPYRGAFTENENGTLSRADGSDIRFTPDTSTKEMLRSKLLDIALNINSAQIATDTRNPHQLMTIWSVTIRIQQLGYNYPRGTTAREKKASKVAIGKSATRMIKTKLGREPLRVARLINGVHLPTNAYCTDEELQCLDDAIISHFAAMRDIQDQLRAEVITVTASFDSDSDSDDDEFSSQR